MNKVYLLISLMLVFLSCQQKTESNVQYIKELVECKKITFPVDENTYYLSKSMFQFEEEGKEFLFFGNLEKHQHEILIYDIATQDLHKRIPLMRTGPNGLVAVFGIKPFNDSRKFVVFQHNIGQISFIDGEGKVLKRYMVREDNGPFIGCMDAVSYFHIPSFSRDSLIYFRSDGVTQQMKNADWIRTQLFASLDLKTGAIAKLPFCYPPAFNQDVDNPAGGYAFSYDYNYAHNRLVCSFTGYDSLLVTDDLKNIRYYDGKSRYQKSIRPKIEESAEGLRALAKLTECPQYYSIMYDKYRDVYYRFVEFPYELKADEAPMGDKYSREFSIIVFDKDFNIIGETKFPGNKYFYKMCFVGKDGLYISENNLNNPEFDENKLVFACFKLEDLKNNH